MPWFRIVATVAAMDPSLFMPARMKIREISRRPSAEMEETSAFVGLSVFIAYPRVDPVVINTCAASFRDAGNANVTCATAMQTWRLAEKPCLYHHRANVIAPGSSAARVREQKPRNGDAWPGASVP